MTTAEKAFSVPTPVLKATDISYVEFEWYAPTGSSSDSYADEKWDGELQVSVYGQYRWDGDNWAIGTKDKNEFRTIDIAKINFTASEKPEISTALPSYESNKVGLFTVPWYVSASKISSMAWTESGKGWTTEPGQSPNGSLYLDAYTPHKGLQVRTTYQLSNGLYTTQVSNSVNINMIHKPTGLKTEIKDDGDYKPYAQLSWTINDPSEPDFFDSDMWEIQRNVSGNPEDADSWQSIGFVDFQNSKRDATFTFKDDGLLDAFDGNYKIYYRIRRINTAMWGWNE